MLEACFIDSASTTSDQDIFVQTLEYAFRELDFVDKIKVVLTVDAVKQGRFYFVALHSLEPKPMWRLLDSKKHLFATYARV